MDGEIASRPIMEVKWSKKILEEIGSMLDISTRLERRLDGLGISRRLVEKTGSNNSDQAGREQVKSSLFL